MFLSLSLYLDKLESQINVKLSLTQAVIIWWDKGMKDDYTKLFHKILKSSIWDKDDRTRLVWITLLAMRDSVGVIESTMKGLARAARVPEEDCRKAIEEFLKPDPDSLTTKHEGRRLEVVEGGWRLLNHEKYVQLMGMEQQRAYWRDKKAEQRHRELERELEKSEEKEHQKRLKVAKEVGIKAGASRAIKEGFESVNLQSP